MVYVLAALVSYAWILVETTSTDNKMSRKNAFVEKRGEISGGKTMENEISSKKTPESCDKVLRIAFPATFFIITILFFVTYHWMHGRS